MDISNILDHIHNGILLYWRALGRLPGMELYQGDIEYVLGGPRHRPERIFNVQLAADGLEQRLDEIAAAVRARELPDAILISPKASPANLADLLAKRGFRIEATGLCMAMDLADYPPRHLPEQNPVAIQVGVVEQTSQLRDWTGIVNPALFGGEVLTIDQVQALHRMDAARFFLACYEGIPAAVSLAFTDGITGTVEFVATLEEFRNRGLGTAVTLAAVQYLKDRGLQIITLRADPDGIGIYQKIGFKEYCKRVVAEYPE